MKKFFTILCIGAVALVLSTCNDRATPRKDTTTTSKLTLEQVFEQALKRQTNIKSMSANIDLSQVIQFGVAEESMKMTIDSQMDIDMIANPLAMHLIGTMAMPDLFGNGKENSSMPIEMYMKQDQGFFMKEPTTESWMRIPSEQFDAILDQTASSTNAKEQLEQLKQYINHFTFEQTDNTYVLTLNAKGDQFKELIQSEINKSLGTNENPLTNLAIDQANYTIIIDKETFDTNKIDMNFNLKINMEGQESTIKTKTLVTYSEINHLDTIDIPQTIIDHATVIGN